MRRTSAALLLGAALALAACDASAGGSTPPTWQPSPPLDAQGPGARANPIVPTPSLSGGSPGQPAPGSAGNSTPSPGQSGQGNTDPMVVATHLAAPTGLALLPDGTALVGERTTGRIVRVQPRPGQPVRTVRTLPGLDTTGDGGLLDLALSPTYTQDGLIYAYVTTAHDNRVVDFTLTGPVTPVLTGIAKGTTDNTGRIAFGGDGNLYIGTGDAGHPSLAVDTRSLAGKVLRVDDIGDPATGNPTRSSPVFTTGHHVVDGLCAVPNAPTMIEVEAGSGGRADDINTLVGGASYGWPQQNAADVSPIAMMPDAYRSPGGCAVLAGRIWITSLDGRALLSAPLRPVPNGISVAGFGHVLDDRYGRLRTVVAAPDGALWLTTSNRDGHGDPVPDDERVIRYLPSSNGGRSPV